MKTSLHTSLPVVALILFLLATLAILAAPRSPRHGWLVPATLCAAFLAWSLFTVTTEGLLGVWPEHTRNAWGNQIWFDLLLAFGLAWTLLVPRALAAGMRPFPWLVLLLCTGSIGLFAMMARCLFIENHLDTKSKNNPLRE